MAAPTISGVGTRSTLVFYTLSFDEIGFIKTYADAHFLWPEGTLVNCGYFSTFAHPKATLELLRHITIAPSRRRVLIPTRRNQKPSELLKWLAQSQRSPDDPTGSKAMDKFMISTTPLTPLEALKDATGGLPATFQHRPNRLVAGNPALHALQTGTYWFNKARRLGWSPGPAQA